METALVLGGSIAGLVAARVLADHADQVWIVEPDLLEDAPVVRRGTPHGGQAHTLLGRGRTVIDRLLPGIVRQLVREGGQLVGSGPGGAQWFLDGRPKVPVRGGSVVSVSRPFLEWHIRRRVLALPNVALLGGTAVGLTATAGRVDGALVRPPGATGAQRHGATLVVDATGRSSRLADWLGRIGYPAPDKRRMALDLGYATCLFHREPGQRLAGHVAVYSVHTPSRALTGPSSMTPVEGNRWLTLVSGYGDRRPGRDLDDFLARCRSDPAPPLQALPAACEPAGEVRVHRFPDSVRREFDRLDRFPAGLVAIGDAVASFNPTYGQGISVAAMQAVALAEWLAEPGAVDGPAHAYFRRVRAVVDDAWEFSAAQDCYLPHVTTARPFGWRLRRGLAEAVQSATVTDEVVHRAFLEVVNLTAGPARLRRPDVLWRTGVAALRRARPGPSSKTA
ncbi:FAD-dependent oxidoreductase [Micromonospora sp. WMMD987]|uniref:FAD-dependent oxidoreductase n=1 Tax=Micromonospora TaxID=1873 RepID=UPI002499D680|nr:FAD-dependent oxidoreductase [Micromonospora sp. WMMD987]WFE97618.1 FAD-dependent oxidoreductase [Micromonospora sp. WMMD987]